MALGTTALTVLGIASAGLTAVGQFQQGRAQAAAQSRQAQIVQQEAAREREIALRQSEEFRRRQSRVAASGRSLRAGSGITNEGSPLLISEDIGAEIELGALTLVAGGETRAGRLDQEAELLRSRAGRARRAGAIGAGTTLLTGGLRLGQFFGGGSAPAPTGGPDPFMLGAAPF